MSDQLSVCPVCGCAVTGTEACPLCGAATGASQPTREPQAGESPDAAVRPVAASASRSGSAERGKHGRPACSRRRLALVLAIVGVVVIALCGAAVFLAWANDQDLKQRAADASSGSRGIVEVRATRDSALGNASGCLAGGGIVVSDGFVQYWANAKGVYRQEISSKAGAPLQLVASDRAAGLNVQGDALYYLASTEQTLSDEFAGQEIRVLRDISTGSDGPRVPEVLYRVEGRSSIGSLAVRDGVLYFVEAQGDECVFMEMPCDGAQDAKEIARCEAEKAWSFVEDDTLYAVSTTAASWSVEVKRLDDAQAGFRKWGSGSGRLKAACVSGGLFYYSLAQGQGASHLHRQDATGGFSEYPEVGGVLNIAADGDLVACVCQTGDLMWVHSATGFDYNLGAVMEESLANPVPGLVGLGAVGDSICFVDNEGGSCSYDVNTGESVVLS